MKKKMLLDAFPLLRCSVQQKELSMRAQQAKGRRSGCFAQLLTGENRSNVLKKNPALEIDLSVSSVCFGWFDVDLITGCMFLFCVFFFTIFVFARLFFLTMKCRAIDGLVLNDWPGGHVVVGFFTQKMRARQCFWGGLITKSFFSLNIDLKKKKKKPPKTLHCHSHWASIAWCSVGGWQLSSLAEKPNPRQDVAVPLQSSASCRTQQVPCFA